MVMLVCSVEIMIPAEYGASFVDHKSEGTFSSEFPVIWFKEEQPNNGT